MINFQQMIQPCSFCEGYGKVRVITNPGNIITVEKCMKRCRNGFNRISE